MKNSTKKYYAVAAILKEVEVSHPFGTQSVPCKGLADGCNGVLLVFNKRKNAETFSNGKFDILTLEQKPVDEGT